MNYPITGFLILLLQNFNRAATDVPCTHFLGEHCYEIVNFARSNTEAVYYCHVNGGILVTIKGKEIQDYLLPLLDGESNYWIGLRIISGLGVFSDGSSLTQDSFAPWSDNYQDKQQRYCVTLQARDRHWLLHECDSNFQNHRFICQYPGKPCSMDNARIANGFTKECVETDLLQPQKVLNWECNPNGYFIDGPPNITCLPNGEWTDLPHCKEGCNPPQFPKSTTILHLKDGYDVAEAIPVYCKEGFFGIGEELLPTINIVCQANGSWLPTIPECLPFKEYEKPFLTPKGINIFSLREEDITLNCPNVKRRLPSYITWYKNGNKFATVNFSTHHGLMPSEETRRLILRNFSESDEGYYSCVLKNDDFQQISSITYNVRLKISEKCSSEAEEVNTSIEKYMNTLLECRNLFPSEIRWYKDGDRIWGNSRQLILPDGILMLKRVTPVDEGIYTCLVTDLNTQCILETKFHFSVIEPPPVECGVDSENSDGPPMPWLASFWKPTDVAPFCYGVLLDARWVLTTASCIIGSQRKKSPGFEVKFNIQKDETGVMQEISIRALEVKIHPQFSRRLAKNDVGLVYLEAFLAQFNPDVEIHPICLPTRPSACEPEITGGFVLGFGSLNSNPNDFYHRAEEMLIVPEQECEFDTKIQQADQFFCAKGQEDIDEDELFAGDIGSPFQVKMNDRWTIWGIFTSGDRSTGNGPLDFFIKIEDFLPWINLIRNL